jgi:hypothetical protein
MSPAARQRLIEAGIPPLIRRSNKPTQTQPSLSAKKNPPKPVIHVDEEYIEAEVSGMLSRLPSGQDAYTFPEIAAALKKSENWVRTRFKNDPRLRDTGNGTKKYFQVPRKVLIEYLWKMYVR